MAPNFSLRSSSCIASPPTSSPSSSSVVVSEISKVSRPLPLPLPLRPCRCILTHTACFFSFWTSAAAAAAAFAVKCRYKRTWCSPPLHLSCSCAHTCLSPGGACTSNGASTLGLPTGLLTGAGRDAMLAAMAAGPWLLLPAAHHYYLDKLPSGTIVLCALPFGAT